MNMLLVIAASRRKYLKVEFISLVSSDTGIDVRLRHF